MENYLEPTIDPLEFTRTPNDVAEEERTHVGRYKILRQTELFDNRGCTELVLDSSPYVKRNLCVEVSDRLSSFYIGEGRPERGVYESKFYTIKDCAVKVDRTDNRTKIYIFNKKKSKREVAIDFLEERLQ